MANDWLPLRIMPGPSTPVEFEGQHGGIVSVEIYRKSLIINIRLSPIGDDNIIERVRQAVESMIVTDETERRDWFDRVTSMGGGPDELFARIICRRPQGRTKAVISWLGLELEVPLEA